MRQWALAIGAGLLILAVVAATVTMLHRRS
jgi:hypothetical protein